MQKAREMINKTHIVAGLFRCSHSPTQVWIHGQNERLDQSAALQWLVVEVDR